MIPDHARENIERFLATISPWEDAYSHAGVSYFAVRREGILYLLQSRLFLHTAPSVIPRTHFETDHVLVGYFSLAEIGIGFRDLITELTSTGRIKSPVGELVFPLESEGKIAAYFFPFHQEGVAAGNRLPVLMLTGAQRHSYVQQPEFDWELKAASQPFDSLQELLFEYSLGSYRGDVATLEVVALNVMEVVFSSTVVGEEAEPSVYLAKSLNPDLAQIGYRVFLHGKVVSRESIFGKDMVWSEEDRSLLGVSTVRIPRGAALHCVASYDGFAQHHGWIADPANSQNPRRATLEEFDDKLEVLRDYLFEEQKPRKESRDFEFGVAWLMWMLGFNIAQTGGTARTSDAADIVATTPTGNILIVECTTGLLKDNKLAKLIERSEGVKRRLISSGNSHLKLISVIVTSKTMDEVKADIAQAQKLGIAVVTKEVLSEVLGQTVVMPDAERLFDRMLESVQPRQEQLELLSNPQTQRL